MILSSFLPSPNTLFVPANQVFFTASQISTANAGSVWEKVSGEYSNRKLVPCCKERKEPDGNQDPVSRESPGEDCGGLTSAAYCSASSLTSWVC